MHGGGEGTGDGGASRGEDRRKVRCLVAEPRPLARDALVRALSGIELITVVGQGSDQEDTLRLLRLLLPDVVLLGHSPPLLSAEVLVARSAASHSQTKLLVLLDQTDVQLARRLLRLGAIGCLPPVATPEELIAGVLVAAFVDIRPPWDVLFPAHARKGERPHPSRELSQRECEVLQLLADGLSAKQIAQRLTISTATVRTHLTRIYGKLGASSAPGAVAEAFRLGLVT